MRNLQISLLSTASLMTLLVAAPDVGAQQTQSVGIGQVKRAINVTQIIGEGPDTIRDDNLYSAVEIGGLLYVAGINGLANSEHKIYIVDPTTDTYMGNFPVPGPLQTNSNEGARDLDKDLAGNIVMGGDTGFSVTDISGNLQPTIQTNAGAVAIAPDPDFAGQPNVGDQDGALQLVDFISARSYYGIAFNPGGDGGNGSFIGGQDTNAVPFLELRISTAEIIREYTDHDSIDTYGLTFDPLTGTLWSNGTGDFGPGEMLFELDYPNAVDLGDGEWDLDVTGNVMAALPRQFGMNAEFPRGLNFIQGGDPQFQWGSAWDMMVMSTQNRIEWFAENTTLDSLNGLSLVGDGGTQVTITFGDNTVVYENDNSGTAQYPITLNNWEDPGNPGVPDPNLHDQTFIGTFNTANTAVITVASAINGAYVDPNPADLLRELETAVVNSGGAGYTLGDILTVDGGALGGTLVGPAAQVEVTGEAAGVITDIAILVPGVYSTPPPATTSVTGGTGAGAMVDLTFDDTAIPEGSVQDPLEGDNDDWVGYFRMHQFATISGWNESRLQGSNGADPLQNDPGVLFQPLDTINWGVSGNLPGGTNLAGPRLDIINLGAAAQTDGVTPAAIFGLPGLIPELVALNPISIPAGPAILSSSTVGTTTSVPLPGSFTPNTGEQVRIQSFYFEPAALATMFGFAASNEFWFTALSPERITFEAEGPGGLTVNIANPRFRITEFKPAGSAGTDDIVRVLLSTDPARGSLMDAGYYWDTAQTDIFDILAAGNGTMQGCSGTYRTGSDVACGLIYSAVTDQSGTINTVYNLGAGNPDANPPVPGPFGQERGFGHIACFQELWPDPNTTDGFPYQPGYLALDEQFPNDNRRPYSDYWWPQTLEFNFTPGNFLGKTFGFDADLDGGPDAGNEVVGMYVEVEIADGTVFSAVTLPGGGTLSIIGW